MTFHIRPMQETDWEAVRKIYLQGIQTGNATFQTSAPSFEEWDFNHLKVCRFVAEINGEVVGWVALLPTSSRDCYRGVAELSIYILKKARGQGVGKALMAHLIQESEAIGFWTLQSGIFPENKASLALHEQAGFRVIGVREKVAMLNTFWRDVVLVERRSQIV